MLTALLSSDRMTPPSVAKRQQTRPDKLSWYDYDQLKRVGKIIRQARETKNITLDDLQKATGYSRAAISNLERAESNGKKSETINIPLLALLCETLKPMDEQGRSYQWSDLVSMALVVQAEPTSNFPNIQDIYHPINMNKLVELIINEINRLGINEAEFAQRALLSPSVLKQIIQGQVLENMEIKLGLLSTVLTDPRTGRFFSNPIELAEYCGMLKNHNHVANDKEENYGSHTDRAKS